MTHSHSHSHAATPAFPGERRAARIVMGALACFSVAIAAGAIILWPQRHTTDIPLPFQNGSGGAVTTVAGQVVSSESGTCGSPSAGQVLTAPPITAPPGGARCHEVVIAIDSGPNSGATTLIEFGEGPGQPVLSAGEKVRVIRQLDQQGTTSYAFSDYERTWPLVGIAALFALVVAAVAGARGVRALFGILIAFAVMIEFLLPALQAGEPALPVALVASAAILFAVVYLAHGVSLRTSAALLGTLASLVLGAVLSWAAIGAAHLTGLSEEQNNEVAAYLNRTSITGLLLAGCIIGSLGVLNDVTITQASAVFELAAAGESRSRRTIFRSAMRIGRDHIASTVYTLVLAYSGSALPLLLLFSVAGRSLRDVLTGESVAIEIMRSSVGGMALALSVPLTTAIAIAVIDRPARSPATRRPGLQA